MPKIGKVVTPPRPKDRQQHYLVAQNKIEIENGVYPATIVEVWIFNVDKEGKFTHEHTDQQKVAIKFQLSDYPEIILERRMRAYISPKAKFAKLLESLTGIAAGSREMEDLDTENLVGLSVMVNVKYKPETGYADIEDIMPAPKRVGPRPRIERHIEEQAQKMAEVAAGPKPKADHEKLPDSNPVTPEIVTLVKKTAKDAFIMPGLLGQIVLSVTTDTRGKQEATEYIEYCTVGEARTVLRELKLRKAEIEEGADERR